MRRAPLVIGIDGSPESAAALEWAAPAAADQRLPLRIVHVIDSSHPETAARALQVLSEAEVFARSAGAGPDVSTHLQAGDPGEVLVRESELADLVVLASHGHSLVHDAFSGSVCLHVARHARCPVIITRPSRQPEPGGIRDAVGRVLVGIDGSPLSLGAAGFAFGQARRLGVGLTALHSWLQPVASGQDVVVPLSTDIEALQTEHESLLSESLEAARQRFPDVDVREVTLQGNAGAALTEASAGARLVVIGSRGRGPFAGMLLGSVTQAVLHHAGCPVAVIHRSDSA